MSPLPILLELQAVHDNLATIQRDLTQFPPDMAQIDAELKSLAKRIEGAEKSLGDATNSQAILAKDLKLAEKLEDMARTAMKGATQKVQFTAAIRELDDRERQKASVLRPLKETETKQANLTKQLEEMKARQADLQTQFEALNEIFLAEHENQVEARDRLQSRKTELEKQLENSDLVRFNRLLQARKGQALASVEGGNCMGCRTKLRHPLLTELREKSMVICESCQRILYTS